LITILGNAGVQGVYLLRLALSAPRSVAFGRFAGGRVFVLPAGDYLYVGSALGKRGATALAGRLLRHATRSGDQPAHAIREALFTELHQASMHPKRPMHKRCHWHIDYLLEQHNVTLRQIYALRTATPIEAALARWLMAEAVTTTVVPGLGSSDDRGATHLFYVTAPTVWWQALPSIFLKFACTERELGAEP
jgi:Uri superfamily endonuclease